MVARRRETETPEVSALRDRIAHLEQLVRNSKREIITLKQDLALTHAKAHKLEESYEIWWSKGRRYKTTAVLQARYINELEQKLVAAGRPLPRAPTPPPPPIIDPAMLEAPRPDPAFEGFEEPEPPVPPRSASSSNSSSSSESSTDSSESEDQPTPPRRRSKSPPRKTTGRIRAPPKRSPDVCYPTWDLDPE